MIVSQNDFEPTDHWYPKALNATIHPMVKFFFNLDRDLIVTRYCHLHPTVSSDKLREILNYRCKYFQWGGADLLNVTSSGGKRQMVVIENNSCPSGQKSMPLLDDNDEQGSYRLMVERTFKPYIKKIKDVKGDLAVVYDKNEIEVFGYAKVIADVMKEPVHCVTFHKDDPDPKVFFEDGIMYVKSDDDKKLIPIRAAFRYLTQKPWNRLPLNTKTKILNPTIVCLAGGRNKMVAAKAYDIFNAELKPFGLKINIPETIWDVRKEEIPLWVNKLGGQAVIKVPYSNAGQGVYTIINEKELDDFMKLEFDYDLFIIQSLIGNSNWSSITSSGKLYHVGMIPNLKNETYIADVRLMVSSTKKGILPLVAYARRAKAPLKDRIDGGSDSWEMLGTNLSYKEKDGSWGSDAKRLLLMDRRDFNKLGLGLDDLIEAYIQTVLSTVAIDKMAKTLINTKGVFKYDLFKSLNNDQSLLDEIKIH
ncbi:hypothetical protein KORDIASMS9_02413 [Kordia sp. SMS9]|uniref:hypothetical protein n=1 Tax=Kordia sp. SMS9 TaxID=2282170 RepID=UPI000E0D9D65|nr:hypothetical protein [Kordia sp. SMS9]AXG70174.1 hypothetical protein KORDIASMS9_02413 [Kordia sp. SMS9]